MVKNLINFSEKFIPSMTKLMFFQSSFNLEWWTSSFEYFLNSYPNHFGFWKKIILNKDIFAKKSKSWKMFYIDVGEPSNIRNVSFAYWESLYSSPLLTISLMCLLLLWLWFYREQFFFLQQNNLELIYIFNRLIGRWFKTMISIFCIWYPCYSS